MGLKLGICYEKVVRPGFQILISDLISNRKICNKNILGYITKAMNIQLNLSQFDVSKIQKLYVSMALNGFLLEIEIFFSVMIWSRQKHWMKLNVK